MYCGGLLCGSRLQSKSSLTKSPVTVVVDRLLQVNPRVYPLGWTPWVSCSAFSFPRRTFLASAIARHTPLFVRDCRMLSAGISTLSSLESLPSAILERVLHQLLVTEKIIKSNDEVPAGVALFNTSKRLRKEALNVFWTKNHFLEYYSDYRPVNTTGFLHRNITRIRHLTIDLEIGQLALTSSATRTKYRLSHFIESLDYCMHQKTLCLYFSRFGKPYGNKWSSSVDIIQPLLLLSKDWHGNPNKALTVCGFVCDRFANYLKERITGEKPIHMPWLNSNQSFPFLSLPAELRNNVYWRLAPERSLYPRRRFRLEKKGSDASPNHQIVLVNRQIRAEATAVFRANIHHELDTFWPINIAAAKKWVAIIGADKLYNVFLRVVTPLPEGIPSRTWMELGKTK